MPSHESKPERQMAIIRQPAFGVTDRGGVALSFSVYVTESSAAWPEGLVDAWHDWYLELREKAERDYSDFAVDDGPWTFWTTPESIATPEGVEPNR